MIIHIQEMSLEIMDQFIYFLHEYYNFQILNIRLLAQ